MNSDMIALWLAAFAAQIIGTLTGFGSATILTPIAILFMDIKLAIPLVAFYHLFANIARLGFFYRTIEFRVVRWFGVAAVIFGMAGAWLSTRLSSDWLQLVLGVFLCWYVFKSVRQGTILKVKANNRALFFGGVGSGTLAGLIGAGGAIRSACLLAWGLPKEVYLGTSALIAACVDLTRLPVYLISGDFSEGIWKAGIGLIVAAFAGAWGGKWLVNRVSQQRFVQVVLALLGIMGVRFVWKGLHGIL